jgi:spore coat polysaccharide biosynthesis predicted glycosyltransferase SpsG
MNEIAKPLDKATVAIRVDGHRQTGMGHVSRMVVLAKYLRDIAGVEIFFISKDNPSTLGLIRSNGFCVYAIDFEISSRSEQIKLTEILQSRRPNVVIVDVLDCSNNNKYLSFVKTISQVPVITFTDVHHKMHINSAVVINSSILHMDTASFYSDNYYLGLDYCLLGPDYIDTPTGSRLSNHPKVIMVCMGGVDHNNLTLKVLKALDQSTHDFEFSVIMSSLFTDLDHMETIKQSMRHNTVIHYDVDGIYEMLNEANLAITAGGNAHAERIAAGVPGIVISQETHQDASAREYDRLGATLNLGLYSALNEDDLLSVFDKLYVNSKLQDNIVNNGCKLLDGYGLQRVSNIIIQLIFDELK